MAFKQFKVEQVILGYRPGFLGLWDHFVSLVRNKPVAVTVPHKLKISLYAKAEMVDMTMVQVERSGK